MGELSDVEALLFDVFGTVVDWKDSITRQLSQSHQLVPEDVLASVKPTEWEAIAVEWRRCYYQQTGLVAKTGSGSDDIDVVHRQILDTMLESPRWQYLAPFLNDDARKELTLFWHKLDGWPDASAGLYALKQRFILGTLSNGSARLLIDLAKHADLPWDVLFSGDLLHSFKPNPKMYLGAAEKLHLPPHKVIMVAAHIKDLEAAASYGLRTIYVKRHTEDTEAVRNAVKPKSEGGNVDVVVNSFTELAEFFGLRVDA